jgi:hypothetical protein
MEESSMNTVNVQFEHEIEELGITLSVEATVKIGEPARLGGLPENNSPAEGNEVEEMQVEVVGEADNIELDENLLHDVYLMHVDSSKVWAGPGKTEQGTPIAPPPYPVWQHDGGQVITLRPFTLPRRHPALLSPWDSDEHGREYVRHLVSLHDLLENRVLEEV